MQKVNQVDPKPTIEKDLLENWNCTRNGAYMNAYMIKIDKIKRFKAPVKRAYFLTLKRFILSIFT